MQLQDIRVETLRIAFATAGEGPPLVLLHGGWSDSRVWRRQLEGLEDDFAVAAWDTPGCGRSSDPPGTWRMADYADCLAAWLDAAGIVRPHVLGLSWGGTLALELSLRHPDVPASLVLASAYAGWKGSMPPEEVDQRLARVEAELDRPPREWAAGYIPGFLTKAAPPALADELLEMMHDVRAGGMRTMLRATAEADLRDALPRIRVPTLLIYGELDTRSPLAVAEALQAGIPGAELVVLRGVGHLACAERPDEFNAGVRRFLSSL
jgi:pimeloyl-ACP methyl ester carboxylesterase